MSVSDTLQFVAGVLEIAGAVMMANAYVAVKLRDLPILLGSALFRGRIARGAQKLQGALTPEDRLTTLQGLALITLGFVLQLIAIVSRVVFLLPPAS